MIIRRPEQGWWRKDEKGDISAPQVFAAPRNGNIKGKIAIAHLRTWVPSNMFFLLETSTVLLASLLRLLVCCMSHVHCVGGLL